MTTITPPPVLSRHDGLLNRDIPIVRDAILLLENAGLTCECWVRHCDYPGYGFIPTLLTHINEIKGNVSAYSRYITDTTKAIFLHGPDEQVFGRMVLNAHYTGPPDSRVLELHTNLEFVVPCNNTEGPNPLTKILHTCAEAFVIDYAKMLDSPYTFIDNPTHRQHVTMVTKCPRFDIARACFLESMGYTLPAFYGHGDHVLDSEVSFRKDVYVTHPFSELAIASEA